MCVCVNVPWFQISLDLVKGRFKAIFIGDGGGMVATLINKPLPEKNIADDGKVYWYKI